MKDKNKKSEVSGRSEHERKRAERRTRRSGTPVQQEETRELNEIDVTTEFKDLAFPTRLRGMNTILVGVLDDVKICYLCMDIVPGTCILHLYLPLEHRNTETIRVMQEMFSTHVHPWCKDKGILQIIVNCPGEDLKTTEMFKTFGFNVENINMAIMPVT
jgi:hypothetical protein